MSEREITGVTDRMNVLANEVSDLRGRVKYVEGNCERRHDEIAKAAIHKAEGNEKALIVIQGIDGKGGTLKEIRDDMTAITKSMEAITTVNEKIRDDLVKADKQAAKWGVKTTILWGAACTIAGSAATYLFLQALGR